MASKDLVKIAEKLLDSIQQEQLKNNNKEIKKNIKESYIDMRSLHNTIFTE